MNYKPLTEYYLEKINLTLVCKTFNFERLLYIQMNREYV